MRRIFCIALLGVLGFTMLPAAPASAADTTAGVNLGGSSTGTVQLCHKHKHHKKPKPTTAS